jgi:NADH-quinone oxidoreductase subunit E
MLSQAKVINDFVSDTALAEIDHWVNKFPTDKKQSALLQALRIVQDEQGWLPEDAIASVADYLDIPKIVAFEVATFYGMYHLKPVGKVTVELCNNLSCMLSGAKPLFHHIKQKYGIDVGQTTADGKLTLKKTECLGACVNAPVCKVGREYHENLTPQKLDQLIEKQGG